MSVLGRRGVGEERGSAGSHRSPAGLHCSGPHPLQGQRFLGMTLNLPVFPCPVPAYLPEKRKNQAPLGGSKLPTHCVGCWGLSQPLATCSVPALCLSFPLGMMAGPGSMLRNSPRERPPPQRGLGSPYKPGEAGWLSPPPGLGWKW